MADLPLSPGLHAALSSGAEIGLARAVAGGADSSSIQHFLDARLGELTPTEQQSMIDLAKSIVAAGKYVSSLEPDEDIEPSQIPTNGDLFGGDWGGKRLFWFGEWNIPGTDEWYKFSGTLPDVTEFAEISAYAAQLASGYIEAYPAKFHDAEGGVPTEITVRILGTEKAF